MECSWCECSVACAPEKVMTGPCAIVIAPNRTMKHSLSTVAARIMCSQYDRLVTAVSPARHGIDHETEAPYMAVS